MPKRTVAQTPRLKGISEPWLHLVETLSLLSPEAGGLLLYGEPGTGKALLWEYYLFQHAPGATYTFIDGSDPEGFTEWTRAVQNREPFFLHHWNAWPEAWISRSVEHLARLKPPLDVPWGASLNLARPRDIRAWSEKHGLDRLSLSLIHVPPLRERVDDITVIAQWVLDETARQYQRPLQGWTPEALERLRMHPWWGNVRELVEVVKQAVFRQTSGILIELDTVQKALRQTRHFSDQPDWHDRCQVFVNRMFRYLMEHPEVRRNVKPWHYMLDEVRRVTAQSVLQIVRASEAEAARMLGVSRRTLRRYTQRKLNLL